MSESNIVTSSFERIVVTNGHGLGKALALGQLDVEDRERIDCQMEELKKADEVWNTNILLMLSPATKYSSKPHTLQNSAWTEEKFNEPGSQEMGNYLHKSLQNFMKALNGIKFGHLH